MDRVHLFDRTSDLLKVSLDIRSKRHLLLVSNIANQDTPGYMARDISFKSELARAVAEPARDRLDHATGSLTINTDETVGNDLNTVNIELEMQKMASNTGNYNALASIVSWKYRMMGDSISGEGR
ncbi:MAG: flagellar basal body rod protein FlgB [Nitrospirota bacterium]|nr:flagellar basal body rod protein FlgB [Nitrospirota bacterium]